MPLPSPSTLLGIPNYNSWYAGQENAFCKIMDWYHSPDRFLGMAAPTGSGKSVLALLAARMSGARTVILTATKGLQNQYAKDATLLGGANVVGQNNFPCTLVRGLQADEGPCHEGIPCPLKQSGGCPYHQQLQKALSSGIIITNYAYYLAQTNFSSGLGDIGLLILDESHQAFSAMESYLTIFLSRLDVEPMGIIFPGAVDQWAVWQSWAGYSLPVASDFVSSIESEMKALRSLGQQVPGAMSRSYRSAKSVVARLERLSDVGEDWVIQQTRHGFRFTPKWIAEYSTSLFQSVSKVMLMSAILSPKTADSLGVPIAPDRRWIEVGSYFPSQNTPVWHIPTARISYRTDDYGSTIWAARIDQIISRRLDRKGIIFTVSYDRARLLMSRSRYSGIMVTHSTGDVIYMVNKFKSMKPPAVLVSPTVTTGWDFPGNGSPQYIIMGKIPYPDTKEPVMVARRGDDKDWTSFLAMETAVQESGRCTRGSEDKTEVLICDDSWRWFWPQYKHFAPQWFRDRVRGSLSSVPDPLV